MENWQQLGLYNAATLIGHINSLIREHHVYKVKIVMNGYICNIYLRCGTGNRLIHILLFNNLADYRIL